MRFDRLRLSGFKSFVDPTDLVILAGLTGVVGPNGCGKSNLLEALRWIMGENRPTAMRGDGMEDVIFAGTTRRHARAHAEVSLTVDNRDRLAPAGFNDDDRFDITRRITRDAGSAYRIGGRDVRARDVQMLFADASTGAHSPALVRQGQISELIGAKPKSRRRILEEAAGISGLYARRHEAELKLNAAEANLTRVDDTVDQLSAQAAALARQARAAARYTQIAAALRLAEGAVLYRRWADADGAQRAAQDMLAQAMRAAIDADAASLHAEALRTACDDALPPLREEEQIATALLSRVATDHEALAAEEARLDQTLTALTARIAQLDRDIARETALNQDAGEVMAALATEKARLSQAGEGHDDLEAQAAARAAEAADSLHDIEARLTDLTDQAARLAARHQSSDRLVADLRAMADRADRAAGQASATVDQAGSAGTAAAAALDQAEQALDQARDRAGAAEDLLAHHDAARADLETREAAARAVRASAEGEAAALAAERAALTRLVDRGRAGGDRLLDHLHVAPGFEAALGAALGDDLTAGLAGGGSGWQVLPDWSAPPPLPPGTQPLAPWVQGAAVLARRLSQTGLAQDAAQGAALQPALLPGQRLVTRAGDLFRWDGLRVLADQAGSAAALHLQKVNDLSRLTAQAAVVQDRAQDAARLHDAARDALSDATRTERAARDARREAERHLSDAARLATRAESDLAMAASRSDAARAELARHQADAADARVRLAEAQAQVDALPDRDAAAASLDHARMAVEGARIATLSRRAALDDLRREGAARDRRLTEITREETGWRARLDQAGSRAAELAARRAQAADELTLARARPAELAARRSALIQRDDAAQARLSVAVQARIAADDAARDAAQALKDAQRLATEGRERRATAQARRDAATDAEATARARIRADADATPQDLRARLGDIDDTAPAAGLDDQIARLRTARDALGAVNLRAAEDQRALEAERDQLAAERTDLQAAIDALRTGISTLNREGRDRLLAAFQTVNANFTTLFTTLFGGGEARLVLVESDDPLEAGLEIMCQPPGKRLSTLSLLSGGEQTLTAMALIFAVFLANPAPICVLDEVDAPLDDANVTRFCDLLDEMTRRTDTRFLIITHHAVTMARMDRLFGVTMVEQGISQLVSVDLKRAEALVA